MKYRSLNLAAVKIAYNVAHIAKKYGIPHNSLYQVKHLEGLDKFGFIGVLVLYKKIPLANITVDMFNNQITDSKIALQYLSLRTTKLIEKYTDPSYESI